MPRVKSTLRRSSGILVMLASALVAIRCSLVKSRGASITDSRGGETRESVRSRRPLPDAVARAPTPNPSGVLLRSPVRRLHVFDDLDRAASGLDLGPCARGDRVHLEGELVPQVAV